MLAKTRRLLLERHNWPLPSTVPLPLFSPHHILHSALRVIFLQWHFKTPPWLPPTHAYGSKSWTLTLPTELSLFFQPHYVPLAPILPILQPCWFYFSSCLRTFAQAVPLAGMLFLSTLHLTSFRFHLTYILLRNTFCDYIDHTLDFCVTVILLVCTWLISVFLDRLHGHWKQRPMSGFVTARHTGASNKGLLNEWMQSKLWKSKNSLKLLRWSWFKKC